MPLHPPPTNPDPGQQAEDTQLYRHILHDVLHMATDLARIVHTQAVAEAQAAIAAPAAFRNPPADPTIPFDRIARAIRRTIALARTPHEPVQPARAPHHRAAARQRIVQEIEAAIARTPAGARPDTTPVRPAPKPHAIPHGIIPPAPQPNPQAAHQAIAPSRNPEVLMM